MTSRTLDRRSATPLHVLFGTPRAIAICLAAGLTLAASPLALSATSQPNTLAPQDQQTTPGIATHQQRLYHHLADDVWNKRDVPRGLPAPARQASARDSGTQGVSIEVHDVDFELADGVGFYVKSLKGMLVPHDASKPVNFDDPDEYDIHVYAGTVVVRPSDLDALFNQYVLTYEPRALSSVENHTADNTLKVSVAARLFKFIPPAGGLPTNLSGPIKVSDDNQLVYTPDSVKSLGLPLLPVLKASGLSLSTITPFKRTGVRLDGNQLIMNPATLFPPPALKIDDIKSATLSDDGLTLVFNSPAGTPKFAPPPVDTDSYIWLQSGDARFYGTVLVNTRLLLMNNNHKRLHFNLYHYRAQSAAGRIKSRMDGTLIVRVPNAFDKSLDNTPEVTRNAPKPTDR